MSEKPRTFVIVARTGQTVAKIKLALETAGYVVVDVYETNGPAENVKPYVPPANTGLHG